MHFRTRNMPFWMFLWDSVSLFSLRLLRLEQPLRLLDAVPVGRMMIGAASGMLDRSPGWDLTMSNRIRLFLSQPATLTGPLGRRTAAVPSRLVLSPGRKFPRTTGIGACQLSYYSTALVIGQDAWRHFGQVVEGASPLDFLSSPEENLATLRLAERWPAYPRAGCKQPPTRNFHLPGSVKG